MKASARTWRNAALCAVGFLGFGAMGMLLADGWERLGWGLSAAGYCGARFWFAQKGKGRALATISWASAASAALAFVFLEVWLVPLAAFLAALAHGVSCAMFARQACRRGILPTALLLPTLLWGGYLLASAYLLAMRTP